MYTDNNPKDKITIEESDIEITVQEKVEDIDASATETNKSYVISDNTLLHNFVKVVLELKELVKCPLCLDVLNQPIEISCSHCFCKECIQTFFEEQPNKPKCPVCRSLINKRSLKPNESLLGYIGFINDVNDQIRNCLDCEVTELGNQLKTNKTPKAKEKKRTVSVSSTNDIIPATNQTPKRSRPPRKKRSTSATAQAPASKIKQKEATPKLKDLVPHQNPIKENMVSIIHWLNDNKNKFDRITQTQQTVSSKCSQESFDMPSVSQIKGTRREKCVNLCSTPRRKSFTADKQIIHQNFRIRCNSWPCEKNDLNNFLANEECLWLFLEETRKTAELKQKEEEFLNSIENELEMQKKSREQKVLIQTEQIPKKTKRKAEKNKKKQAKRFKPLVPPERQNTVLYQNNNDLGMIEAYFNNNLSKISNNGIELRKSPSENKKPVDTNNVVSLIPNKYEKVNGLYVDDINKSDKDDIFEKPTQKVVSPLKQEIQEDKLFTELEICIENIERESCQSTVTENCQLLRKYTAMIQKILKRQNISPKLPKLPDICFHPKPECNTTETQTEVLLLVNAAVQTDEKQNQSFTSSSTVLSKPFNGSLLSKLVEKYGNTQNRSNNSQNNLQHQPLSDSSFDKFSFNTQDLLKNKENTKEPERDEITNSLDNIDFDTQQLIQKHNEVFNNHSEKSLLNLEKKSVIRKLNYSENQSEKKKFKRIRTLSDSDSDTEVQQRKRNKYLQEDMSVQFESEVPDTAKSMNEEVALSNDSNYNIFVDNILRKYDGLPTSTSLEVSATSNRVIERCEKIIKQVEKSSTKHEKVSEQRNYNDFKPQKEKHVFSSDEIFNDDNVLQAIERDIEKNKKHFSYENQKININNSKVQNNDLIELNDSFDEEIALLDPQNNNATIVENKKENIKVLQNITVIEPKLPRDIVDSDDEIFSDIDIVENTPPRNKVAEKKSLLTTNEAFDVILPPPPEFQEEGDTITLEINTDHNIIDKTLTEHLKVGSATPEFLSPALPRSQIITNKVNMLGTSTPNSNKMHSQRSISISPIAFRRDRNPFEVAKCIEESPLTVVANTPSVVDRKIVNTTPKQQQSILCYVKPSSQENVVVKKPCITCSRLENEYMIAVSALANKKLVIYTNTFGPNVTHVVVAVDEKKRVKDHTMKYVCGVAAGIWVVSFKWVQQCLAENKIVPEEAYEVKDVSGVDGPKQSRLTRTKNPLFKGFKIFAAPPFFSTTQADVENVIKMLGGKVVSKPNDLLDKREHICIIISEASATQDFDIFDSWLEMYKVITVDIEWLSRSVGQYKLMSLKPFALCTEDHLLDNLGYPEEMVSSLISSSSQSTGATLG